jgi:hypothetical protein
MESVRARFAFNPGSLHSRIKDDASQVIGVVRHSAASIVHALTSDLKLAQELPGHAMMHNG